ncbi:MAG: hypothetical protein U1F43_12795 [Myxococcota bacterium]
MKTWLGGVVLTAVLGSGLGTSGAARADGVWVGTEVGSLASGAGPVVLELRHGSVVVSDANGVWQGKATFTVSGAATKGGDMFFDVDFVVSSGAARSGAPLPGYAKARRVLAKWRENSLTGKIAACLSTPGVKAQRPSSPTDPRRGVHCYDLERVVDWTTPTPPPTPTATPLTPEPNAPEPLEKDLECMRECRQRSQMKAISADAIEAECRATCTPK